MVLVQRRTNPTNYHNDADKNRSSSILSVGYGDGRNSPVPDSFAGNLPTHKTLNQDDTTSHNKLQRRYSAPMEPPSQVKVSPYQPPTSAFPSSRNEFEMPLSSYFHIPNSGGSPMWLLKLVYAAVVFSWILSYVVTGSEKSIIAKLENQIEIASLHVQYLTENIQEIRTFAIAEKRRFIDLKDSRRILEQEAKAISEKKTLSKYDSSSSTNMQMVQGISTDKKSTKTVLKWHENRKSLLRDRIMFLQRQLQESSRTNVIEKFGIGPHRVKMTFELNSDYNNIKSKQERNNKTIIVELASIDEMPISVHFFLELVSNKIWDDTIFIHHEQRDHVIAVPPISYTTQRPKTDEMKNVGWTRLGYPEYSNKYPHKKYTIGFANQGPTFYINTMDNTENHGPNGQQHHLLAGEGDPCFGTIVGGLDAIDEIIQFGLSKNQQSLQKISNGIATNTSGAEDDPLWTRFIKAEII